MIIVHALHKFCAIHQVRGARRQHEIREFIFFVFRFGRVLRVPLSYGRNGLS